MRRTREPTALSVICELAHDASTGPATPDAYWQIRQLASDIL